MPQAFTIPIRGMHCASCEVLVGKELKKIGGVVGVSVNQKAGTARVEYGERRPTRDELRAAVQTAGYEIGENKILPWFSKETKDYSDLLISFAVVVLLYLAARSLGIADIAVDSSGGSVWVAILVGLVAGISTCMALIGGLSLGLSARHAELHPEATSAQKFRPHIYFNAGRVIGYAGFGGLAGFLGGALKPSTQMVAILTIAVGFVMIFLGLKLIEIFPRLRDRSFALPSGIAKWFGLHRDVKEYSHTGSFIMGSLTFFLPCGFTQAMQLWAISSGNFLTGAGIMALFAIGTAPGLLGIGGLTSVMRGRRARYFFMTAGIIVLLFGFYNLKNGWSVLSFGSNSTPVIIENERQSVSPKASDVQIVRMIQDSRGYRPSRLEVKKGQKVRWIITSTSSFTCAASIVMPDYDIEQELVKGENIIEFTPTRAGRVPFTCFMGMYRGEFIVKN